MASFFAQIRRECSYWRILRSIVRGPDASDRGLLPRYGAPGYISPQANLPCRHDWLCGADRAHMDLQVGGVFMEQPSRNPRDKERVDVGRGPEYLAHEIGDLLKLEKAALRRRWAIVFDAYASRHLRHYLAMGREGTDRRLFVLSHEAAVAEHVGAEYGGEFAFHAIPKNQNDLAVSNQQLSIGHLATRGTHTEITYGKTRTTHQRLVMPDSRRAQHRPNLPKRVLGQSLSACRST